MIAENLYCAVDDFGERLEALHTIARFYASVPRDGVLAAEVPDALATLLLDLAQDYNTLAGRLMGGPLAVLAGVQERRSA